MLKVNTGNLLDEYTQSYEYSPQVIDWSWSN